MNKVILSGNLGQDPELRQVGDTSVTSFSLATTKRYKTKTGEKAKKTEWHNVKAWGKKGEVINQYLKKGNSVLIEGELQYEKWEDKNGNKRQRATVVLNDFEFIGGKTEAQPQTTQATKEDPNDLPF
jgi:single-strand DNA-binding protein